MKRAFWKLGGRINDDTYFFYEIAQLTDGSPIIMRAHCVDVADFWGLAA